MAITQKDIIYEDNHIIAVNKKCGEIVQGDKTEDSPLVEDVREFIRRKYDKPGNVFCGLIHRLDRPVSGVVLFAKTSKALTRMNKLFNDKKISKKYWAIVKDKPPVEEETLEHYILKNSVKNKSYVYDYEKKNSKRSSLTYKMMYGSNNYYMLEIDLHTGRHHQIRAQLASIGCPIKGDLKYGFARSNKNGGIDLHARSIEFEHPTKKEPIKIIAPPPAKDNLWKDILESVE
ncbi:MAG: RluA family pseudouridine synthase [Bacteroidales bacterium]|jgi:23S rRNA pseudouridine1911/1915/1917 synthase|nr:RluA family pseudouridine synthase [Bacteroidales bacterium]